MSTFSLIPSVDPTQEFIEIAYDFSNPLDLVREAISNSFDAGANHIEVLFDVITEYGEKVLITTIRDNGHGMDRNGLQSFFDLGNSLRRGCKTAIGEKGHGTKVYLNSEKIEVCTVCNGVKYIAVMDSPNRKLHNRQLPEVIVQTETCSEENGTTIHIRGYNHNRRGEFTHAKLKDYIKWFTKMGSIELEFGITKYKDVTLLLKGVDADEPELIEFGHVFPKNSKSVNALFDEYLVEAPKWYCKKIVRSGNLENFPEIKYDAIFCVEGTKVKYEYNPMIRRAGYSAPKGAYTIQERYGLWICKDYIPIQRKNEWITQKGSEYTRFHAFINCQDLRLTANRSSVENTPSEILEDLKNAVINIYNEIVEGNDWRDLDWLESQAQSYNTIEKEKKDFAWRLNRIKTTKIADYKGIRLVEPKRESGVFSLFMQLDTIDKDLFPFTIVDYDTHSGIDVIVKAKDTIPIVSSKLFYVEFKYYLEKQFNHSFENLHSIICWDIDAKNVKHGDEIEDIAGERRTLKIIPPSNENDYTRFFLDDLRSSRKIEIFVLRQYLEEKCRITFRIRNEQDTW
jgi:hypothetical protein